MSDPDKIRILRVHPQVTETIELEIPVDALAKLRTVAEDRDMSVEALVRFYVGQGLRQDLARLYSERIIQTTERVLARHIASEDERTAILREIRGEAAA